MTGELPDATKSPSVLAYIQALPRKEVDALVHSITEILYSNGMTWEVDKQWHPDDLEVIADTLGAAGIYAAVETHDTEKVFP